MVDKYSIFFNSIKDFTIIFGMVEDNIIKSDSDYLNIGLTRNQISKSIVDFLSIFISQVKFKYNSLGSSFFNFSSIQTCQNRAIEKGIYKDILNVKTIEGWEEREANFENSKLLFLKYDIIGSCYLFVDSNRENPFLYVYWEGGELSSEDIVFTSYVRGVLFWELLRQNRSLIKTDENKIKKIKWLKFYENEKLDRNKLVSWRYEFNCVIEKQKKEENHLLGIDEFEVAFIQFLIEKKGIENIKSVFNPYGEIETFEEYLDNIN